jgi:L-threonylcarbamoyladenylate synthase
LTAEAGATDEARGPSPETLSVDGRAPEPRLLARAAQFLVAGELLIYPTDTLYALGGIALDSRAAARVRLAKGRGEAQPLPLVAADLAQVGALVRAFPEGAGALAERFWPGPLTLVLECNADVPEAVTAGTGTVALRVPALRLARELCQRVGPLISTSANRSGAAPPLTCQEAVAQVGGAVRLALDAGPGRPAPSTIVELRGGEARLIREGAVSWTEVQAAWRGRSLP